jgi:hypothetical protein
VKARGRKEEKDGESVKGRNKTGRVYQRNSTIAGQDLKWQRKGRRRQVRIEKNKVGRGDEEAEKRKRQ